MSPLPPGDGGAPVLPPPGGLGGLGSLGAVGSIVRVGGGAIGVLIRGGVNTSLVRRVGPTLVEVSAGADFGGGMVTVAGAS